MRYRPGSIGGVFMRPLAKIVVYCLLTGLISPLLAHARTTLSIGGSSVAEGNSGVRNLPFTITRSGDLKNRLFFECSTADGTATAPSDYNVIADQFLTLTASSTSATITVSVNGDTQPEGDETLFMKFAQVAAVGSVPTFGTQATYALSSTPYPGGHQPNYVALGDLNGDGKLDAIVTNNNSKDIAILLNSSPNGTQTPTFFAPTTLSIGAKVGAATVTDLNGDGRPDIAVSYCLPAGVGSSGCYLAVFINTTTAGSSSASFSGATSLPIQGSGEISAADMNGDGKLDIVLAGAGGLNILINSTGAGATSPTFSSNTYFVPGNNTNWATVGDLNGDGRPDIIAASSNEYNVAVLLNTTTPGSAAASFTAPTLFGVGGSAPNWVAVGDINNDGRLDIVTPTAKDGNNPNSQPGHLSILINQTPPGSTIPAFSASNDFFGTPEFMASGIVGDLNGDGRLDVVVAGSYGYSVFTNTTPLGSSTVRFDSVDNKALSNFYSRSVVLGDMNQDGRLDVLFPNFNTGSGSGTDSSYDSLWVVPNTTDLTTDDQSFSSASLALGGQPGASDVRDLNGDGIPDVAIANAASNTVSVFLNAAGSTPAFSISTAFPVGATPKAVALADLNDDGRPDLITANGGDNTVSVLVNTANTGASTPSFGAATAVPVGLAPSSIAVADFNGDGFPDLAVANAGGNTVSVLLNSTSVGSTGVSFAPVSAFSAGTSPVALVAKDLNGDGKPDLAIATAGGVLALINQTSPGATTAAFGAPMLFAAGSSPAAIAAGDINLDGKPDLVVADSGSSTAYVLPNTTAPGASTATFASAQGFDIAGTQGAIGLRDLTGDGKADLIVANPSNGVVTLLRNETVAGSTNATFVQVVQLHTDVGTKSLSIADLDNNGESDLLVTNGAANSVAIYLNELYAVSVVTDTATGTILDDDGDHVPDPFSFAPEQNVAERTLIVSSSVSISGINAPTAISVIGGEYSIDGGPFTSSTGTINPGQAVRVRHQSATTPETDTVTTVIVGGISGSFTSTTAAVPDQAAGGGALSGDSLFVLALGLLASARRRKASHTLKPKKC